MLVCPETLSPLELADNGLIERLNRAIAEGQLVNRGGQTIDARFDGGLVRADGNVLYPVVGDIPMMLVDEGILLNQPALQGGSSAGK